MYILMVCVWNDCKQGMEEDRDLRDEEEFLRNILSEPSESEMVTVGSAKRPPRTYILSFDNSTITPAPSSPPTLEAQPGKRAKRASHIMAERKRRQQLTQSFIALSATIPGLNKVLYYSNSSIHFSLFLLPTPF